jgi:hypothetical protein
MTGGCPHDPAQQRAGVTDRDELLSLRLRERTSDLAGEDGRNLAEYDKTTGSILAPSRWRWFAIFE